MQYLLAEPDRGSNYPAEPATVSAHSTPAQTAADAVALKQRNLAGSQGMFHQSHMGVLSLA
jgi:hypothetical protein